jgi:hypothetical protein
MTSADDEFRRQVTDAETQAQAVRSDIGPRLTYTKLAAACFGASVAGACGSSILAACFLGLAIIPLAIGIAFLHAILLGVPLYLALRKRIRGSYFTAGISGFVLGSVPLPLISTLNDADWQIGVALSSMLELFRDRDGWFGELVYVAAMGGCGVLAACIFFFVMKKFDPANLRLEREAQDPGPRQQRVSIISGDRPEGLR